MNGSFTIQVMDQSFIYLLILIDMKLGRRFVKTTISLNLCELSASEPISWTSLYKYYTPEYHYIKKLKEKIIIVLHGTYYTTFNSESSIEIHDQEVKQQMKIHFENLQKISVDTIIK